jgi:protein SCO1/2
MSSLAPARALGHEAGRDLALSRRGALALLGLALAATWPRVQAAAAPLPGDSIYQLHPTLTDQDGRPYAFDATRGAPVLVSMFYSGCEMVCPVIFETIAQTVKALPAAEQARARILMISFDPQRDTTAVLQATAKRHGCDERWHLVRASEADVRRVAAVLGVQYRKLPSGEFNHSSAILLVDADGRIVQRTGVLGSVDTAFVAALHTSFAAHS